MATTNGPRFVASAKAADALTRKGSTTVESMEGGFSDWREAGFDVAEGDK